MELRTEEQILEQKLRIIRKQYDELCQIEPYHGDDFSLQVIDASRERQLEAIKRAYNDPYFGRLDFKAFDEEQLKSYYIGKTGVTNEENSQLVIIDWRAPVSSLFYAFSGSEDDVYYDSPDGFIDGEIHLKRNIVVRNQKVQRVVDNYLKGQAEISGGDAFLLHKLGEQKDNRLRDIVSTIQGEQNEIIRHRQSDAVIIQGVAGSGKTTVALHRLAYLLYEYREKIRAEKMIIFAPNTVFLDYISSVLPELGVGDIQQTTFSTWALNTLDDDRLKLQSMNKRRRDYFEGTTKQQNHRSSKIDLDFKKKVEAKVQQFAMDWIPEEDFEPWPGVIFSHQTLLQWFEHDFKDSPAMTKYERTRARLKRWIEIEVKRFDDKKEQQTAKKQANTLLRHYLRKWKNRKPYDLYIQILKDTHVAVADTNHPFTLEFEDLAPLLHIQQLWYGLEKDKRFDHVVIDEAQDFSPYQLSVLKERTRGQSFTILGDLSQGIHSQEGISDWQTFVDILDSQKTAYFEMEKSYRSTYEIIEFSNKILKSLEKPALLAKPVFRSGEDVHIQKVNESEELIQIIDWIQTMQTKEMNTITLITRNEADTKFYYEKLNQTIPDLSLVSYEDQTYHGGISILPVYVAKGLEFDAVLILGADEENYPHETLATKLLYVACTRALHHLRLFYKQTVTPLLSN
ncbi:HelD family protein [Alkalihalobacillus pseudalcaliphilus]|uniref:HelD family protein n=1 Tax=Alkalihalobacillus pseudalcaliphilus TaxID=79884 RepID=UPI00064DCCCD|nr:3'-5' exonuclease [Alkalihalobacillus pseudalcaliphilus]KMK78109.1 hypothetical protein AB990_01285 [Alkalihalobacillus pseudalcaliphilus]